MPKYKSQELFPGVYQSNWWNFELEFRGKQIDELDYPDFGDFECFGVCDSPEQLMAKLPKIVVENSVPYVISMVRVDKSDEPPSEGWRIRKWGKYIGEQEITREYLADEPVIETLWTYHIYQIK